MIPFDSFLFLRVPLWPDTIESILLCDTLLWNVLLWNVLLWDYPIVRYSIL